MTNAHGYFLKIEMTSNSKTETQWANADPVFA